MKMKKTEKNKSSNLSFGISEQVKYLVQQIKGKETYTNFTLKAVEEMFYKLDKLITLPGTVLKTMTITRPSEETMEKINYYITISRVFSSRSALFSFSILHKILNEIEDNNDEEEMEEIEEETEEEIKNETVEEYLERKKLRIIRVAGI